MFLNRLQPGDVVRLGTYIQGAGGEIQPIQWQVLEIDEGRALLLSRHVLDLQPYHAEGAIVRWEDSQLRRWLRSSFNQNPYAMVVSPMDSIGCSLIDPDKLQGVRPAIWLRMEE